MYDYKRLSVYVSLVALIVALASHATYADTVTHLQSTAVASSSSATSLSRAFGSANTSGSLIVAAIGFDSSGGTAWTCSDSQGNTYSQAILRNDTRHNQALGICYAPAIKAGLNTVTVSYGGVAHLWRSLAIHEYSGVAASSPLDKTSGNSSTSAAVSSLAVVPAENGELVFGVVDVDDGSAPTITAGSGFTKRQTITDATSEDRVQAPAGSIAATFTLSTSQDYIAIVATFKASSTAQLPPPDTTPPTGSIVINGGAAVTNSTAAQLTLSATDNSGSVSQMRFSDTGTSFSAAEAFATTKAWTLTTGSGTKTVYVQFSDSIGNWSGSFTDTIALDTTAPSISAVAASSITGTGATVTWTTNEPATSRTDYGTTTSYGASVSDQSLVTSHSLNLTGLASGSTYNYRVRSIDAAGNEAISTNATFTTPNGQDTAPPSVPANLQASNITTSAVTISWSAATDDVAVAGYRIFRNGSQIGTTAATSYPDGGLTANTTYAYSVSAFDSSNNVSSQSAALSVTTGSGPYVPAYPLKMDSTKRYLIDQNNVPFLMVGDSPQAGFVNLSEADADFYFANRQALGFNTLWVNLLCNQGTRCDSSGRTYDGIAPFTTPGDLSTPNEAYFTRMDHMLTAAASHNLLVILDPAETIGWLDTLLNNGVTKDREYGRYLGNRYKNFDNIIWMSGNDYGSWSNPSTDAAVQAVALGILDNDTRHLQTVELTYNTSGSLDDQRWAPIIGLDAAYTYYATYAQVLIEYNRPNHVPVFMVEANYEFEQNCSCFDPGNPSTLRRQEYWTMLSGATGQLYGSRYTWPFPSDWKTNLTTPGAVQFGYLRKLFEPRRWYQLVPDQNHTVVTAGYGTFISTSPFGGNDYVTTGATPDGGLVMAYVPQARTITVNMAKLAAPAAAQWFDPSNNTYRPIAGSPFANSGSRQFTHPGANSSGDVDWVLVLEATLGPDTEPPSTPANLTATPASSNRVDLAWSASTDNQGVAGYDIYRGGVKIATSPTNSFSNTGLNSQTTYSYMVAALDAAGNSSAQSTAASATTLASDTLAPSVPTGLASSGVTASSVTISWNASTDNVSVSGYQVFRNGISIGSTSATSYSVAGLTPSTTYSFTVVASDTSGNVSAQSQPLSVTTVASAPVSISFIQQSNAVPQSPQSIVSVTYTKAQTAGNTNILAIAWNVTTATITSVTDSKGNAYQAAIPATKGSNLYQAIYYARNIGQAASGANTVTVRFSTAVSFPDIRILEYSGLDPVNPFDAGRSASGTGTAANSGSVTTTFANELVFGAGVTLDMFGSAGAGFVSRVITSPDGDIAEDKTVTVIGTYNATANQAGNGGWLMQVATFRAPSSGSGMSITESAVSLSSTDAPATSVAEVGAVSTAPRGSFDTPATVPVAGALTLTGWALDDVGVNRVEIWRNCIDAIDRPAGRCAAAVPGSAADFVRIGQGVFLAGSRPAVEVASSAMPQASRAGWGYTLLTNALPNVPPSLPSGGQGTFVLSAFAVGNDNQYTLLGEKTIVVDNDHATIPFGLIDAPIAGATKNTLTSYGWALTQNGKCIDASTTASFRVYVDGLPRALTQAGGNANWFPGLTRSDIAAAFPGLCNTNNALAAYSIDVNRLGLTTGLHTIGWDVIDGEGKVASIGNAFFQVPLGPAVSPAATGDAQPRTLGLGFSLDSFTTAARTAQVRIGPATSPFEVLRPDGTGRYVLRLPASGRLALDLGGMIEAGYELVGDELRPLPAGSSLDPATDLFTWAPPVAFSGSFHLIFVAAAQRIDVIVTIGDVTP